jgi:hypothetical protein
MKDISREITFFSTHRIGDRVKFQTFYKALSLAREQASIKGHRQIWTRIATQIKKELSDGRY